MATGRFLGGVVAVIWSLEDDVYLLLQRAASKDFAPGVWECVTGRLEQGEGFIEALHREMKEELGTVAQPVCMLGTAHFYRGIEKPQNELIGIVFGCEMGADEALTLSIEHDASLWVTYEQAMSMLDSTDPSTAWLRRVIQRAEITRKFMPQKLKLYFSDHGFELG